MKKLTQFENWFIQQAVDNFIEEAENEIKVNEKKGKRGIFASGYFTMVGKDIKDHIDLLTLKNKK